MGVVAAVYGCILFEEKGVLKVDAIYYTFGNGQVAFASDHFQAEQMKGFGKAVPILENSVLLFDVDESSIEVREYAQKDTLILNGDEYLYVNEVHLPNNENFVMYCLLLPDGYYPKRFYSGDPHYAGRKGDRIVITWFFKEQTTIKVGIAKDGDRAAEYMYIERPTFRERHPKLWTLYDETKDFAARILSKMLPNGG